MLRPLPDHQQTPSATTPGRHARGLRRAVAPAAARRLRGGACVPLTAHACPRLQSANSLRGFAHLGRCVDQGLLDMSGVHWYYRLHRLIVTAIYGYVVWSESMLTQKIGQAWDNLWGAIVKTLDMSGVHSAFRHHKLIGLVTELYLNLERRVR